MFKAQLRRQPFGLPNAHRFSRLSQHAGVTTSAPIVRIKDATIYKDILDQDQASPLFKNVDFNLSATNERWAIIARNSSFRTHFLQVLNGRYLCTPPDARTYPQFTERQIPLQQAIGYIGFDAERDGLGGTAVKGAYMSQRYEAHREVTDWSLLNYLEGNTELNALEKPVDSLDTDLLARLVKSLDLEPLIQLPVSNLSNGQTRRARIAKALLAKPELLLLNAPFMGLDPVSQLKISSFLQEMAENSSPKIILAIRPEEDIPPWITHILHINPTTAEITQGTTSKFYLSIPRSAYLSGPFAGVDLPTLMTMRCNLNSALPRSLATRQNDTEVSRDYLSTLHDTLPSGEPLVEMQGVKVSYSVTDKVDKKTVLGNWSESVEGTQREGLWWNVHRGERWGVFGPNGSGKTTLLSLITSDHPQTYGLPIKLFGRSRIPSPGELGISIFELQSRIGHSSPEVHTYFPKQLSVRRVLESAWADTPLSRPRLTHQNDVRIGAFLRWFAPELSPTKTSELQKIAANPLPGNWRRSGEMRRKLERLNIANNDIDWADSTTFRDLSFSSQRVLLFLRALVNSPDLVILDEALSGMDEEVRDKCLLFLSQGEKMMYKPHGKILPGNTRFVKSLQADNDMVNFGGLEDRQALLTISHNKEDTPGCIRQWICLPEPGQGESARTGTLPGPLELHPESWRDIWKLPPRPEMPKVGRPGRGRYPRKKKD
ncbi:P-loop containing nucleoside triphosphate hydrolase protein [Aureobasidium subglaciale]|nr:P-loop containing nucleoside triphosphate hydrolase protein [Aureobasidium subglaciale]